MSKTNTYIYKARNGVPDQFLFKGGGNMILAMMYKKKGKKMIFSDYIIFRLY